MVQVTIANMHCGGCAKGVRATLDSIAPGIAVEIDLERHVASLDFPDETLVLATLRGDGWDAKPLTSNGHSLLSA